METQSEVSVSELDSALEEYVEARTLYEQQKKYAEELSSIADEKENALVKLMEAAGKDKWLVDGFGTVSVYEKLSVATPKTGEDKQAFFGWIKEMYGQDGLDKYMTVNSNSLNSLYKTVTEEAAARGEIVSIPGLDLPTARKVVSLRRN